MLDLDTKQPVQLAEICDLDMLVEPSLECVNGKGVAGCNRAVAHMHSDDDNRVWGLGVFVENSLIDFALLEAKGSEDLSEFLVPASTSLFEPVQGLAKVQNVSRVVLAISRGVTHMQYLLGCELTVQVHTLDVDLVQLKPKTIGHGNDCTRSWKSCDWGIGIKVINTLDLAEPLRNETAL